MLDLDGVFVCDLCFDFVGEEIMFIEFIPAVKDGVKGVLLVGRERRVGVLGLKDDISKILERKYIASKNCMDGAVRRRQSWKSK